VHHGKSVAQKSDFDKAETSDYGEKKVTVIVANDKST
jgi:hypothetical protein